MDFTINRTANILEKALDDSAQNKKTNIFIRIFNKIKRIFNESE